MTADPGRHRLNAAGLGAALRRVLPFAWLALSATWAVVIVVTDEPAWVLAVWIATTVGPMTVLDQRRRPSDGMAGR